MAALFALALPVPLAAGDARDAMTLAELRALGYVDHAPTDTPQKRGVTLARRGSQPGLTLYSSRQTPAAVLINADGTVAHRWADEVTNPWMHVELLPSGHLYAIAKDRHLVKVDWDSRVLWRHTTRAHHDLALDEADRILLLSRDRQNIRVGQEKLPVLSDCIEILSPAGKLERRVWLHDLLLPFVSQQRIDALRAALAKGKKPYRVTYPEAEGDLFHTNSIQVLTEGIPKLAPPGSVLLSVRELDRIVILNPTLDRVLWSWGEGQLQRQHHATLLPGGTILVFDNGVERRQSRVIEVEPRFGRIAWEYTDKEFFTFFRGAAQKLANGNVLITESDRGRAFEVTRRGKTVWEFWNPVVRGESDPQRDAIYRVQRYPMSYLDRELVMLSAP